MVAQPSARELAQDVLGRARKLITAQRLPLVEPSRRQQCLREFVLADLASEHDCAIALAAPIRTFLSSGGRRACKHAP
jgi:hypothetical protein